MKFRCITVIALFVSLLGGVVRAHFVFLLPSKNAKQVDLLMSEDLTPDVDLAGLTADQVHLNVWTAAPEPTPLKFEAHGDVWTAPLTADYARSIEGTVQWGVTQRGQGPAFQLVYHPAAIIGDPFQPTDLAQERGPIAIIPQGTPGNLRFKVLVEGKPQKGAEVNLVLPSGSKKKVVTDDAGLTESFSDSGRFGAWARHFEEQEGEFGGKRYTQVRHYATLVIDVGSAESAAGGAKLAPVVRTFPPLPQATSSFGAVAEGGYLYVYGGHVAPTHNYSTEAVSGRFHRINLANPKAWEELPGGPALQGMNLAAAGGKIYRVGGMKPRNPPGEKVDNVSVGECASYDPATRQWAQLSPLPEARSSHDVAVVGSSLLVIGGWKMNGRGQANDWIDHVNVLDLSRHESAQWQSISQPFERRALIAATLNNKVYVLGGFDSSSDPALRVDILDLGTRAWLRGPDLPGPDDNGFAPAACELDGKIYVSVSDGGMYKLDVDAGTWREVAQTTPRIVHRLIPFEGKILVIGGAAGGKNFDLVEVVNLAQTEPKN